MNIASTVLGLDLNPNCASVLDEFCLTQFCKRSFKMPEKKNPETTNQRYPTIIIRITQGSFLL